MARYCIFIVFFCSLLTGCASIPQPTRANGDPKAAAILQACANAHGYGELQKLHDVSFSFAGTWSWIVPRVQPVLVDIEFRGSSVENYLVHEESTTQTHTGPGGTKTVAKSPGEIHVFYNGKETRDADVKDAAALVIDDYRMCLLGPAFFLQRTAPVEYLGTDCVDDRTCDRLLATLKPGLGHSTGDRVILSIDQEKHLLRRVRLTVEGLSSTQGAVADIYLRDQLEVDGVVFPMTFYEELKRPFNASVHNWKTTSIRCNRLHPTTVSITGGG